MVSYPGGRSSPLLLGEDTTSTRTRSEEVNLLEAPLDGEAAQALERLKQELDDLLAS